MPSQEATNLKLVYFCSRKVYSKKSRKKKVFHFQPPRGSCCTTAAESTTRPRARREARGGAHTSSLKLTLL